MKHNETSRSDDRNNRTGQRRSRWERYTRVVILNALKGASTTAGGAVVSLVVLWVHTR